LRLIFMASPGRFDYKASSQISRFRLQATHVFPLETTVSVRWGESLQVRFGEEKLSRGLESKPLNLGGFREGSDWGDFGKVHANIRSGRALRSFHILTVFSPSPTPLIGAKGSSGWSAPNRTASFFGLANFAHRKEGATDFTDYADEAVFGPESVASDP